MKCTDRVILIRKYAFNQIPCSVSLSAYPSAILMSKFVPFGTRIDNLLQGLV